METKKKKVFTLVMAWDRSSSNFLETYGAEKTLAASEGEKVELNEDDSMNNYNLDEWNVDTKTFKTKAEMIAYIEGVNDGNGWDKPMTEELK